MDDNAMVVAQERQLTEVDIRKQVNLIQKVMKEVMKPDVHYGVVPGCGNKPTLLKPGAEKLAMTFRLSPSYTELPGSGEDDDQVRYKIECRLTHISTGRIVGTGLGACNSKEKKYRTRAVFADRATDEEKAIGKKETRNGKSGKFDVYVIPQDPWDVQNTVYKMACKRAFIAAILNATAASDIFTQDIEELPEGTVIEENGSAPVSTKPPVEMPKAKAPEPPKEQPPAGKSATISEKQAGRLYAIAKGNGYTKQDVDGYLAENYGVEDGYHVAREYYDDVVSVFQTLKAKDE
ncbi:MAG: hypothetical protein WC331_11295 [Candidatus Omnitrophota bacterium]|jgi:hypothetical protein